MNAAYPIDTPYNLCRPALYRLRIMIRGKKVKTKLISKSLSNTESDSYRPRWLDASVPVRDDDSLPFSTGLYSVVLLRLTFSYDSTAIKFLFTKYLTSILFSLRPPGGQ